MRIHHVGFGSGPETGLRARQQFAEWRAFGFQPGCRWLNVDWDVDGVMPPAIRAERGGP